jgi:thioredoxin-related protein
MRWSWAVTTSLACRICVALIAALAVNLPMAYATGETGVKPGLFKGAKTTETPSWFKESFLNFEDDIDEAAASGKRLMLYFHQEGCPYCNALIEDNFTQPDIHETVRNHLDVVEINMWGDREVVQVGGRSFTEKSLAQALDVNYTPTLLFFNESKKVALRLDGYYPPDEFRKALRYVIEKKDGEMPYAKFVAMLAIEGGDGELNGEEFFDPPPFDLDRVADSSRPLAVYFERPNCISCDALHHKILTDPPTRKLAEQFDSVQLDLRADSPVVTPAGEQTTIHEWVLELDVKFAPTVVFFDSSGREVMRTEAMFRTFHTQSVFDYVLSGAYKTEPNFQRYITERAEHFIEQGFDVDIWGYRSDHGVETAN